MASFFCRLGARGVVHPGKRRQALAHRRDEVGDELVHLGFVVRREKLRDVELADALADEAVEELHAALPAIALHFDAGERLAIEVEVRVVERFRQVARVVAREMEGEILLPRVDGLRVEQRGAVAQRRGLVDDEVLHAPKPATGRKMSQSTAGIIAARPARSTGLLVACTSRRRSGDQCTVASSVSRATTASALAAGLASPMSSKIFVT